MARIHAVTAALLRRKGYHGTSMADVAEASGLRKASLYHHWAGKDELVAATLAVVRAHFDAVVLSSAHEAGRPVEDRLERLIERTRAYFAIEAGGCLFVDLGCEGLGRDPAFAPALAGYFDAWSAAFAALARGFGRADPERIGRDLCADLHGAVVVAGAIVDAEPIERFFERLRCRLRAEADV